MKVTLALLASAANCTNDGKLNMLGVFQSIYTASTPIQYPQFDFVAVVQAELGEKGTEHSFEIRLRDADGKQYLAFEPLLMRVPLEDPRPNPEMPVIFNLVGILFPRFGHYEFGIYVDDQYQRSIDLLVQPIILPSPE